MNLFSASVCVVASLLFLSGCGPVSSPPSAGNPAIYAFSMPGCLGCVIDQPHLVQLERAGHTVHRVDITISLHWRRKYRIDSVPFYLVVRHGKIVLRTHDLNLVIRVLQNGPSAQTQAAMP